jgi:transposase-like protein
MIRASSKEAEMGRRGRVDRTHEQKLEIVLEGMKSGNIAETCRRYEVAANLYYRWKDEALQGASAALGGEKRRGGGKRERPTHWAVGALAGTEAAGD